MKRLLTEQELHNLAMNVVGKKLEADGYEFIAVNSTLKKHPQFVCIDQDSNRYFVIVQYVSVTEYPVSYDVIWMETFKEHARKNKARVLYAQVGLGSEDEPEVYPSLDQPYLLQFEGLQLLDVELN
jgi:hypothetical protein